MSNAANSNTTSLPDRYQALINEIVEITLKGQIRSKEQVYQLLLENVSIGTGEIFERCLDEQLNTTKVQLSSETDELKKAKKSRILRALQTIEGEWKRWQKEHRFTEEISSCTQAILSAEAGDRFTAWLRAIDSNQTEFLPLDKLRQLAKALKDAAKSSGESNQEVELQQLATGITRGLESWQRLEGHLLDWIYQSNQSQLGFSAMPGMRGPWASWSKQVSSALPKQLFNTLAFERSVIELATEQRHADLTDWVELAVILQCLQQGLVAWFEKQPYDSKVGTKMSTATFLTFAVVWCQLSNGLEQAVSLGDSECKQLSKGCFQMVLQTLRSFAQRKYFSYYSGFFVWLSGSYLGDALNYLSEPLREFEGTQDKARILTLLGYSQRIVGQYQQATSFHQEALEIARNGGDQLCEIANLNHLSRTYVAQKNYAEAINYSQRALILSRQIGDRLGEANALANLGYSEVFSARQMERIETSVYETAIDYLKRGLKLSQELSERQSQALCCNSLGIAHVIIEQFQVAVSYLEKGAEAADFSGDLYLQGLNFVYLAEAYYGLNNLAQTVVAGAIGMYLLEQIGSHEWRQTAGLLTILQGQMGVEAFQKLLSQQRSKIIAVISVDGYDHLPQLLEQYKKSLN